MTPVLPGDGGKRPWWARLGQPVFRFPDAVEGKWAFWIVASLVAPFLAASIYSVVACECDSLYGWVGVWVCSFALCRGALKSGLHKRSSGRALCGALFLAGSAALLVAAWLALRGHVISVAGCSLASIVFLGYLLHALFTLIALTDPSDWPGSGEGPRQ
jgi:hypothetical protein